MRAARVPRFPCAVAARAVAAWSRRVHLVERTPRVCTAVELIENLFSALALINPGADCRRGCDYRHQRSVRTGMSAIDVARGAEPLLRDAAGKDLVELYARVARPEEARGHTDRTAR